MNDVVPYKQLTAQQEAFVVAYVAGGGNATQAAREAGFSEKSARQIGGHLTRKQHVMAAIRMEQQRTLRGRLASKALRVLEAILDDSAAPHGARVDAAKTLLDRAGLIAPRTDADSESRYDKPLNQMSVAELEKLIRENRKKIAAIDAELAEAAAVDAESVRLN